MKGNLLKTGAAALMLLVAGCTSRTLRWEPVPSAGASASGYAKGVSAPYAGVADGVLLMAGGANFPDLPAAEGGKKGFYDEVFALRDGAWHCIGHLPEQAAYGVTLPLGRRLVLLGGANGSGALRRVITLGVEEERLVTDTLTALPFAWEQGAGAVVAGHLYIAGGVAEGVPSSALWRLDTKADTATWQPLAAVPEPFVQPVMAYSGDALYLWGGFNPSTGQVADRGYRYDIATDTWHPLPGIPDGGTLTGGCAATLPDGRILCSGGVDRTIFTAALQLTAEEMPAYLAQPAEAYRFRRSVWCFDPATGTWSQLGDSPCTARAGAALVVHGSALYLLGGELKPGIRTPENYRTNTLKL